MDGGAVISCQVTPAGLLALCEVVEEKPAGFGFGEAALKLAPLFKMAPITKDGLPAGPGRVCIPIQMKIF